MAKKNKPSKQPSKLRQAAPHILRGVVIGSILALIITTTASHAKKQGRLEGCSLGIVAALAALAPEAAPDMAKIATACQDITK